MAEDKEKIKEEEDKFLKTLDELLISDIPFDCNLTMIKEKQSEIINKHRELTKKIAINKKKLYKLEVTKTLAERHWFSVLDKSNTEKVGRERFTDKTMSRKVEEFVSLDEKRNTIGIYEQIKDIENRLNILEMIWKTNHDISSRVENMLNAQINIDKKLKVTQGEMING